MKKYFILYIIIGISLLAGFLFYAGVLKTNPHQEIDNVAVNEITSEAAQNWENLIVLNQMNFTYRFVIIDNRGNVHYASNDTMPDSLSLAIRQGFLPMDVVVNNSVVGKVLIETLSVNTLELAQKRLKYSAFTALLLLCSINIAFLSALHQIMVKPFIRLEMFAHKITTGMLDEPLPMDKYNIFGLFTQSFDIMRASLLEARQNQIKAEQAKKELVASLSHDIKTPITSIRLITELLQAMTSDPIIKEKLKTIEIKTDQIDHLVNDLMHSTLEELGELNVNLSNEESGVLRELFGRAGHFSEIKIAGIPECLIELDLMRMEQVIGNIVSNSYKYAGTKIDVDFRISGEVLVIDINDYGKGVDIETLELICTKFYRGENAKALQKEGEGLGLYIAKLLMEKMNGGLEAFNRPDGFTIRLWVRLSR